MRKIDCHMHVSGGPHEFWCGETRHIIDAADRFAIDQFFCSIPVLRSRPATLDEVRACKDDVLRAMRQYPDPILDNCYLNPGYPREALQELDRWVAGEGMVGIKQYLV